MRHIKLMWAVAAVVAVVYIAALCSVRISSSATAQYVQYERWRENYVMTVDKQRSFVNTGSARNSPVVLSEGQGYGLYITAMAGARGWAQQRDYDSLLNYYLANRDNVVVEQRTVSTYLMKWRQYMKGQRWVSDDNSATDGDLYIAYSLSQAAKVWPQRSSYYQAMERRLTSDILTYEYNDVTQALTVGDWANEKSEYSTLMRTSDVIPTFFEVFYESTHDRRWLIVKNTMLDHLVELSNEHDTGLIPDFAWLTSGHARAASGKTVSSKFDGDYAYNACRVPMMLATSDDSRAKQVSRRLLGFFERQDVITAGYSLSGRQLNAYQSDSFTAPLVYAASRDQQHSYDHILINKQRILTQSSLTQSSQTSNYYAATLTTMAVMEGIR